MTIRSGSIRKVLLTMLAVLATCTYQAWSQTGATRQIREDSVRSARMDSIYRTLNDTAAWQQQLDFVRNLRFEELNDSDLMMQDFAEAPAQTHKRYRWKDQELDRIAEIERNSTEWEPEPRLAVWFSLLFPGGGQIYNRKLWKLPIVYGGYVGCIYALTWNQSTYKDYQNAYVDIMDDDPNTKSYEDFLPPHYEIDTSMEDWLKDVFKQRKNKYRRYRDLSIFAFAGMYIVAAIDAYVDAELSHFDISPDLSLRVEPNFMMDHMGTPTAGFSLAFNF